MNNSADGRHEQNWAKDVTMAHEQRWGGGGIGGRGGGATIGHEQQWGNVIWDFIACSTKNMWLSQQSILVSCHKSICCNTYRNTHVFMTYATLQSHTLRVFIKTIHAS